MNKEKFIKEYHRGCKIMGIDPLVVIVGYGGVCLLLGIREETNDIDVDIPWDFFQHLKTCGYPTHMAINKLTIQVTEFMSVHEMTSEEKVAVIDGVTCYDPAVVLKCKLHLNREKDQSDIAALKKLLNHPS